MLAYLPLLLVVVGLALYRNCRGVPTFTQVADYPEPAIVPVRGLALLATPQSHSWDGGYSYRRRAPAFDVPFTSDKGFSVIAWSSMLMADWDLMQSPADECHWHTITSRDEPIQRLKDRCLAMPEELWRVYDTPGGVRAFLVSEKMPGVTDYARNIMAELRVDPVYQTLTEHVGGWACRVSPKWGREDDYVARFRCEIGTGICHPTLAMDIKQHDALVKEYHPKDQLLEALRRQSHSDWRCPIICLAVADRLEELGQPEEADEYRIQAADRQRRANEIALLATSYDPHDDTPIPF